MPINKVNIEDPPRPGFGTVHIAVGGAPVTGNTPHAGAEARA
jgi:hypothetical protein